MITFYGKSGVRVWDWNIFFFCLITIPTWVILGLTLYRWL